jgi:hypothetical protein
VFTPTSEAPSIDRISLQRLLGKPSDELTTQERDHFLSRMGDVELELVHGVIAIHPTLSRDERVVAVLRARIDTMSRSELGITLRRCPDLIASEQVITAFHALLERDVRGGQPVQGVADEFAERLGGDIFAALVERAFPPGKPTSDAASAFHRTLRVGRASQCRAAASGDGQPGDAASGRDAKARQGEEQARFRAELGSTVAELKARLYTELPDPDEAAALDATARVALNENIRGELTRCNHGALYYLRYPSCDAVFDANTLALLQSLVHSERLDEIVATDDLRGAISCEQVKQQVLERHEERLWIERVPEWLDATLIERARRVRYEPELWDLVARFRVPGKEAKGRQLLEVLIEHARAGRIRDTHRMAGELLRGKQTLWKSALHGQALVLIALQKRRFFELDALIFGDPRRGFKCLDEIEAALKPQVKAMHHAFGCALLTWANELARAGDASGAELALAALGLLDPPGHFTNEVHRFRRQAPLTDNARHLADHIHAIAARGGGSDAQVYALFQAIGELRGDRPAESPTHSTAS